jgi:hypothetical protein
MELHMIIFLNNRKENSGLKEPAVQIVSLRDHTIAYIL